MNKITCFLIIYPFLIQAQKRGINFEQNLNWKQVQLKAKEENKYIFMDCYASWCAPCKYMDSEVYSNDSIGFYVNEKFISVKIKMDTIIANDGKNQEGAYNDSYLIQKKYKITAFPSYLFFSPNGVILHKEIGAKNREEFIAVIANSLQRNRQYFTILEKYQRGDITKDEMHYLAKMAKSIGEDDVAICVAKDYINNFLLKLKEDDFYKVENFEFISNFNQIVNSKELIFDYFFKHASKIDEVMGNRGFSEGIIDNVITNEEIKPFIDLAKNGCEPDWKKCSKNIKKKYGYKYVERNILNSKIEWFKAHKVWVKYTSNIIQLVEKYGVGNDSVWIPICLNNNAWELFIHSNDKEELKIALKWSDSAIQLKSQPYVDAIDTKANLLYKLGRKEQAIALEEKAVKLAPRNKDIQKAFLKMKEGIPTWPEIK
jgi:thioredoxin-related protein